MNNNQKVELNKALDSIINDLTLKCKGDCDDKTENVSKLLKNIADTSRVIDGSNKESIESELQRAKIDDLKEQQKIRYSEIEINKLKIELEREKINNQRNKDIEDARLEEEKIKLEYAKIKTDEAKTTQESELQRAKIDDLKEQQKIRYSEIEIEKLKIELERERINSQRDKDIRDAHLEEERIKLEYAKIKSEEAKAKQESKSDFIKTTATTIAKGAIDVIPVVSYVWLSLVGLKCELSGEAILPKVFTKTVDRLK